MKRLGAWRTLSIVVLVALVLQVSEAQNRGGNRGARSAGFDAETPIKSIRILRTHLEGACITGELWLNDKFVAHTLELPWRGNTSFISSIPDGSYPAFLRFDRSPGWRVELKGTQPRAGIQIHIGTKPEDTVGCILVGLGVNNSSCKLSDSTLALETLRREFYGPNAVVSPLATINVNIGYGIGPTRFTHAQGAFSKEGLVWRETSTAGPQYTFTFREDSRDMTYIYGFDSSRNMWLRLPLRGNYCGIASSKGGPWRDLYRVTRHN